MATTLSQFYSDKGQALPSVSQRGSLAAQAGIQGYSGTAAQNNQLLNFMQTNGTGQTGTQNLQSIQPPVIPAATALGNTKPVQLPTAPQGTASTELGGASAGYLAMPTINSLNQLGSATQTANQNAQTAQNDYMAQFTGLLNQMQNRPGELEQQYQIQKLSQDAMKAKANYDSVELAYRRKKESAMNNTNLTKEQASNVISDIERKEASQKADIAIDYNLKQGLLSNAKELMNKQLELELEPMKLKVDFYKDNRDRFDKILDKTEMRQYDYIQKKEERAYQAAQKAADRKASLIEKAIDNGTYTSDMKNMSYDQIAEKIGVSTAAKVMTPLTPNGKPDVVREAGNVIKLAKKDVPSASAAIGVMSSLQKFANDNIEGRFIGSAPIKVAGKLRGGEARSERINNQSAIEAINLKVQQWASGASLTKEQEKQVARLAPDKNDTDYKIREKINSLTQFMQQQVKAELASKGISYDPTQVDYFAPSATAQLDELIGNTPNGVSTQYTTTLEENWNTVNQK